MFKKDEYIVCLNTPDLDPSFPKNYIFKQREDLEHLRCEKDLTNYPNGWSYITFNNLGKYSDWRYATIEEAQHYELIGKPYDVTTLPEFILPDNWYILVTEENATDVLTWRFEDSYEIKDNITFLDKIVGMDIDGCKGHNPKDQIKSKDGYDFGNEITYKQFKKYVLKVDDKPVEKEDLSYLIPFLHNLNIT